VIPLPISIPAFSQYQAPLPPLRGLWNAKPPEGDRFVSAEIDWGTLGGYNAQQISLSGNSPVALSQIVAITADNALSGADAQFLFPDTGHQLIVPAGTQGTYPVFTNALMFYVSAPGSIAGDRLVFQVHNSMPPPVPVAQSKTQNHSAVTGVATTNGTTALVPAGVNGTLNSATVSGDAQAGAVTQSMAISLQDGTGKVLWLTILSVAANQVVNFNYNPTGLNIRFQNGINVVVSSSTIASGYITANAYYSTP
jgi:hypothetical protein